MFYYKICLDRGDVDAAKQLLKIRGKSEAWVDGQSRVAWHWTGKITYSFIYAKYMLSVYILKTDHEMVYTLIRVHR